MLGAWSEEESQGRLPASLGFILPALGNTEVSGTPSSRAPRGSRPWHRCPSSSALGQPEALREVS